MDVKITNHAFSFADIHMYPGESLHAAPGSMATMRGQIEVAASLGGRNIIGALFRRAADQTSIMAKYSAHSEAILGLAPDVPGDMAALDMAQTGPLRVEAGALVAYEDSVSISTRVANVRKFLMDNNMVGIRAEGRGMLLVSAYGAMKTVRLGDGEKMVVDRGHLVAWTEGMSMKFGPLSGVPKSGLTGEGFVGQFQGPGTVLVQTRQRKTEGSRTKKKRGGSAKWQ